MESILKFIVTTLVMIICSIVGIPKEDVESITNAAGEMETVETELIDTLSSELMEILNSELKNLDDEYNYIETEPSSDSNTIVLHLSPDITKHISIPTYRGSAFTYVNDNVPYFSETDKKSIDAFEIYAQLDSLGRCGVAYANLCAELMPTEDRGNISDVYPSGWEQKKYEGLVDQDWLYNRCHLIAHSLAGENANERNLITGTRYMNIEGMWQFEETVLYYLKENPKNHVLYRVTPVFIENNLVANGVLMEAYSVEDNGTGVCFNVYCYNVAPGVVIDYATGDSWAEE